MPKQFTFKDGRKADYAISGATNGFPLLWFHGTPNGYLPIPSLAAACERHDVALVTFSRPGYGDSTPQKGRSILDGIADAKELLEGLGYDKCVVGGWSGGGPYTLACAAKMDNCLAAVGVAGGAPYEAEGLDWFAGQGQDNIDEFNAALKGEKELYTFLNAQRDEIIKADLAGLMDSMASLLPPVDQKALNNDKEIGQYTVDTFADALKNSVDGWADDDCACIEPWGFEVGEVRVPYFLYQGSEDKMVPFEHGKWLAKHIPERYLTTHLEEGEGHISIFLGRVDEMLEELLKAAGRK